MAGKSDSDGGIEFAFDIPVDPPTNPLGPPPAPVRVSRPIRNPIKPPKNIPVADRSKYNVRSTSKAKFIRGVKDASGRGIGGRYAPVGSLYTVPTKEKRKAPKTRAGTSSQTKANSGAKPKAKVNTRTSKKPPRRLAGAKTRANAHGLTHGAKPKPPRKPSHTSRPRGPSAKTRAGGGATFPGTRKRSPIKPPRKPSKPNVKTHVPTKSRIGRPPRKASPRETRPRGYSPHQGRTNLARTNPGRTNGFYLVPTEATISISASVSTVSSESIRSIREELQRRLAITLKQAEKLLLHTLRRNAPKRTGRFARSLRSRLVPVGRGRFVVQISQANVGRQGAPTGGVGTGGGISGSTRGAVPMHLVERPTRAHAIRPKQGKPLNINGRPFRGTVRHPGTKGNRFVARSIRQFENTLRGFFISGTGAFFLKSVKRDMNWKVTFR